LRSPFSGNCWLAATGQAEQCDRPAEASGIVSLIRGSEGGRSALPVNLHALFDDRSFTGLLILELDVGDERRSALGICSASMTVAPIDKCLRIDVRANSDIADTLNLFALPFDKSFPVFICGGHIMGIGEDGKGPAVSMLILVPGNSYDIVHSGISYILIRRDGL
jgi:hypothetical protein